MHTHYIGIDVAKDSFVVAYKENTVLVKKATYPNDRKGTTAFLKSINPTSHCIMEATGSYSLLLSCTLYEKGIMVSVINPLQIKRFAQTKLKRTKTDSVDAELIAEYGERMQPPLYQPPPAFIRQLQQQRTVLKMLVRTKVSFVNQLHALLHLPEQNATAIQACEATLEHITAQIKSVEKEMNMLADKYCQNLFTQLQTIPGISKKTAIELIIVSGAFKNFSSAKQFSAFIGICACINESGSSVRGYKGISRVGDKDIRSMLYMCALMAKQCNQPCKYLYERLVAAGKPKKVAIVAVVNKLIKQVFGMIRSGENFTAHHQSTLQITV